MSKIQTAKELLKETIENYNSKVSYVFKFQCNKSEEEMFVMMINHFSKLHLQSFSDYIEKEAIKDFENVHENNDFSIKKLTENYLKENQL